MYKDLTNGSLVLFYNTILIRYAWYSTLKVQQRNMFINSTHIEMPLTQVFTPENGRPPDTQAKEKPLNEGLRRLVG